MHVGVWVLAHVHVGVRVMQFYLFSFFSLTFKQILSLKVFNFAVPMVCLEL